MKFNGEIAILDDCEAVELLEATAEGKALIKRQPDGCFRLESVDLSRITILPAQHSCSLKELTERIWGKISNEDTEEHKDSGE